MERFDRSTALLQAVYLGEDVDHRLGGEAGDARAANVVDLACKPGCEDRLQPRLLCLELLRPGRVVQDDPD